MVLSAVMKTIPLWCMRIASGVGVLAAVGLAALYTFQEKLLYIPKIPSVPNEYVGTPRDYGCQYEDVWLDSEDGTKLHCWHMMPKSSPGSKPPVVLFFQENAGNMSFRLHYLYMLVKHLEAAVFVLGYRGYGQSEGSPSQEGLQMDANAALRHVLQRQDIDKSKIVVLGKSLGGAVALHMAAQHEDKLRAAVVENTFLGVEDMVPKMFPFLALGFGDKRPLNFLVRNKWRNKDKITLLKELPVLMIASKNDNLVPYKHMRELNERLETPNGTWLECPNSGHMDAYETDKVLYWSAMKRFWQEHVL